MQHPGRGETKQAISVCVAVTENMLQHVGVPPRLPSLSCPPMPKSLGLFLGFFRLLQNPSCRSRCCPLLTARPLCTSLWMECSPNCHPASQSPKLHPCWSAVGGYPAHCMPSSCKRHRCASVPPHFALFAPHERSHKLFSYPSALPSEQLWRQLVVCMFRVCISG